MQAYYTILNIDQYASLDEVKKAYRRQAKKLHPDINPASNANAQFILLNEAYEYFINRKTGRVYNQRAKGYTKSRKPYRSYEEWAEKERPKARRRASKHANMKWKSFENSVLYQSAKAGAYVISYTLFILGTLMVLIPIGALIFRGIENIYQVISTFTAVGIGSGLIITFWKDTFQRFFRFDWDK